MARRGRPVKGAELVDAVEASNQARERLKLILQTLAGVMTIEQAAAVAGVGRSRFQAMRQQFLARAVDLLEPKPKGHHRPEPTAAEQELARMREELVELKLDLKAAQIREEIALAMPHLLKGRRAGAGKKTSRTRGGSTRSRR